MSAATGALALCVVPLSALSERYGRRHMVTASLVIAVTVGLLVPFAPNLTTLIVLRAVQGAALAGLPASAMAFLAEEVRPRALVAAVGLFVAGNGIGSMSGRILTGWAAQAWGWRVALFVVGLLSVVCAVVFRAMVPKARNFTPRPLSLTGFRRTVGVHLANPLLLRLYAIGALFMVVFGGVYTVMSYRLVAAPFDLSQGVVGSVFVVNLVGTVSSATSGRVVARLGRRGALYVAASTTAAGLLLSLADSLIAVILGLVLITAGAAVGAAAFHSAGWAATVLMGLAAVVGVAGLTLYGTYAARRASTVQRAASY